MRTARVAIRSNDDHVRIIVQDSTSKRWFEVALETGPYSLTLAQGEFVAATLRGDAELVMTDLATNA